jgi:hypothetical protein
VECSKAMEGGSRNAADVYRGMWARGSNTSTELLDSIGMKDECSTAFRDSRASDNFSTRDGRSGIIDRMFVVSRCRFLQPARESCSHLVYGE